VSFAPGLSISRVIAGTLADRRHGARDGRTVDLEAAAAAMRPYMESGFTTFDMANHYGSAELIAGLFLEDVVRTRVGSSGHVGLGVGGARTWASSSGKSCQPNNLMAGCPRRRRVPRGDGKRKRW